MKDGKSLPVPSARYSERARDLGISNNYIKQLKENKKTWKTKFRSPNSCSIGSMWRWLQAGCAPCAQPVCGMHVGLWPRTLLWWLRGTPEQREAWLPLAASGQVPLSLTEVAAELFSRRIHYGGILGKRGRAAVGRVGVSSRAEGLLHAGGSTRIRGAAAAWGWLTRQVFLK